MSNEAFINQVRRNNLFQEFEKESWDQRLFLFRESIVKRSEFVRILLNFEKDQSMHAGHSKFYANQLHFRAGRTVPVSPNCKLIDCVYNLPVALIMR